MGFVLRVFRKCTVLYDVYTVCVCTVVIVSIIWGLLCVYYVQKMYCIVCVCMGCRLFQKYKTS